MAYCTASDVRALTGLASSDIDDTSLSTIITYATYQLNHDISVKVVREKVEYIDDTRENDIDGSNTTFYVKNWKHYYIGDLNNDGTVDSNDILVYLVDPDGTETTATVSSVTPNDGKFVLSSAPEADKKMYITYVYTPVSVSDPHALVKLACIYLAGAMAFTKIDAKKLKSFSIGKLRIAKQSEAFDIFYSRYKDIVNQIRSWPFKKHEGEAVTSVVKPSLKL